MINEVILSLSLALTPANGDITTEQVVDKNQDLQLASKRNIRINDKHAVQEAGVSKGKVRIGVSKGKVRI